MIICPYRLVEHSLLIRIPDLKADFCSYALDFATEQQW